MMSVSVIAAVFAAAITGAIRDRHTPAPAELRIECTTNESGIYLEQGWRQVARADLYTIGERVGADRARIQPRAGALICDVYRGDVRQHQDLPAALWYWRPHPSPTPTRSKRNVTTD